MQSFGLKFLKDIDVDIQISITHNTVKRKFQFSSFCKERTNSLTKDITINRIFLILTDRASNIKAVGDDSERIFEIRKQEIYQARWYFISFDLRKTLLILLKLFFKKILKKALDSK